MLDSINLSVLAKMIDHSLLHPTMTDETIVEGCELAKAYAVATVCVKPYSIPLARCVLDGFDVGVCAVVAFPHGNSTTSIKVRETEAALADGAAEIDMVVNLGKVLGDDWDYVATEIAALNDVVVAQRGGLKVIFENDYLDDARIIKLCEICSDVGVAFVKTSSGYGFVKQPNGFYAYAGATDHHLRLMREHCPLSVGVKAAGGVRTLDDLLRVRALGATRVGATTTAQILDEAARRGYE